MRSLVFVYRRLPVSTSHLCMLNNGPWLASKLSVMWEVILVGHLLKTRFLAWKLLSIQWSFKRGNKKKNTFWTIWGHLGIQDCCISVKTLMSTGVRFSQAVKSCFSYSLWFGHNKQAFSRWRIAAVAHAFPCQLIYRPERERIIFHHYL